jgi:pyruvate kinase
MNQRRRTKIVATLGPSSANPETLKQMIINGLDLVRLNFSHGTAQDHRARVEMVRKCAQQLERTIGIIADLQGPKIRIARFKDKKVLLKEGDQFILDASLASEAGDQQSVGIDYKALPNDVLPGDFLLLDDGRLVLRVLKISGPKIICEIEVGGTLSNNKGINRKGGGLSAEALTDKDRADLKTAVALDVDYIAISFPRSAQDLFLARDLVEQAGGQTSLIAKIERSDALAIIDEIINACEGVMVARGDLGVEIGDAELPAVQKHIIQRARALDKVVITATQMMESMIVNVIPTRAEVFDVANAVLDGTDAVMLSAETATGNHPARVIEAMARICLGAEKQSQTRISGHRVECQFHRPDEAIAMSAMYLANHFSVRAIAALTMSGATPLWMSRIRSGIPIYALTPLATTERKMTLYRGVYPVLFNVNTEDKTHLHQLVIDQLRASGAVASGDRVLITYGEVLGIPGRTNTLKILEID